MTGRVAPEGNAQRGYPGAVNTARLQDIPLPPAGNAPESSGVEWLAIDFAGLVHDTDA